MVITEPGSKIIVDFDVENVGEISGEQDVTLTAEDGTKVTVDTLNNLVVDSGETDNKLLEWNTDMNQTEQQYQLCVETDDSSDCVVVNLGYDPTQPAIIADDSASDGYLDVISVSDYTKRFNIQFDQNEARQLFEVPIDGYVGFTSGEDIVIYDRVNDTEISRFTDTFFRYIDKNANYMVLYNSSTSQTEIFDPISGGLLTDLGGGTNYFTHTFSTDQSSYYATDSSNIYEYETTNWTQQNSTSIDTGSAYSPGFIVYIESDNTIIWTAGLNGDGVVHKIDEDTLSETDTLTTAFTEDVDLYAYIRQSDTLLAGEGDTLKKINPQTLAVNDTLQLSPQISTISVHEDQTTFGVVSSDDTFVTYDVSTFSNIGSVAVSSSDLVYEPSTFSK